MMQELYKDDTKSLTGGMNKGDNWMRGIDYRNTSLHYNRGITYNKQFARINPKTSNFPVHMQQLNNRLTLGNYTNSNALKANNYGERPFLDPVSSLNTRKDFRIDPKHHKVVNPS